MKNHRLLLILALGMVFLLATSQVFASPVNPQSAQTPKAKTPGAQATEKANEKGANQTGKLHGKHENYKGTVSAVSADSLTLTLRDGTSVTIGLNSDTRIKFPGRKGSAPDGVQAGMNVMAQGIRDQSGNLIAVRVMVIPGKPTKVHRVGAVTAYAAGESISIQDKDGNIYTFTLTGDTKLLPAERAGALEVGSRVTIIAPRDPATGGYDAVGIVIHPAAP